MGNNKAGGRPAYQPPPLTTGNRMALMDRSSSRSAPTDSPPSEPAGDDRVGASGDHAGVSAGTPVRNGDDIAAGALVPSDADKAVDSMLSSMGVSRRTCRKSASSMAAAAAGPTLNCGSCYTESFAEALAEAKALSEAEGSAEAGAEESAESDIDYEEGDCDH